MKEKELYLEEEISHIDYKETYEVITYRDSLGQIHIYETQGEDEYAKFLKLSGCIISIKAMKNEKVDF